MIRCHNCFKENQYILSRKLSTFTLEDCDICMEMECTKNEDLPRELRDVFKEIIEWKIGKETLAILVTFYNLDLNWFKVEDKWRFSSVSETVILQAK